MNFPDTKLLFSRFHVRLRVVLGVIQMANSHMVTWWQFLFINPTNAI